MLSVLFVSNTRLLERLTGMAAGIRVATYIFLVAPLSGMSTNPARMFVSAAPGGLWTHIWIYFTAPIFGMLLAVEAYRRLRPEPKMGCAKLDHPNDRRCIHCGHSPTLEQQ